MRRSFASLAVLTAALTCALAGAPALAFEARVAPVQFSDAMNASLHESLGAREAVVLDRMVSTALEAAMAARAARLSQDIVIEAVVIRAVENQPTYAQLSRRTALSALSRSTGGAELEAVLRSADGREIARVRHRFFPGDIGRDTATEWDDARRAIHQFAARVAEAASGA